MLAFIVLFTAIAGILAYLVFAHKKSPRKQRFFFTGPRCSGKTEALVALLGMESKTVSSLQGHSTILPGGKILVTELIEDTHSTDFLARFHINDKEQFVYFIKNTEEIEDIPDLSGLKVKLVYWKKYSGDYKSKRVHYLEESKDSLLNLLQ
ncbi:hypothetical protein ENBRE01_2529 [Enteropsectra breve]|nr:hypothetical protein ENBRE01_2529 [Enteropsectra breve]